jgi:hypothetical protein
VRQSLYSLGDQIAAHDSAPRRGQAYADELHDMFSPMMEAVPSSQRTPEMQQVLDGARASRNRRDLDAFNIPGLPDA